MSFCGNCYLCDCGGYEVEGLEGYLLDDQVPVGFPDLPLTNCQNSEEFGTISYLRRDLLETEHFEKV